MTDTGKTEINSGLITWIIGQDIVLADDVAARMFGLDEEECASGVEIGVFLAQVAEPDRGRVARQLYESIATNGPYFEEFNLNLGGTGNTVVMKGRSVGDVLFTCIVAQVDCGLRFGKLQDLCLAAYEAARDENNNIAATQLARTISLLGSTEPLHMH